MEGGEWRVEGGELRVESGDWRVKSGESKTEGVRRRVESGAWNTSPKRSPVYVYLAQVLRFDVSRKVLLKDFRSTHILIAQVHVIIHETSLPSAMFSCDSLDLCTVTFNSRVGIHAYIHIYRYVHIYISSLVATRQ